MGDYQTMAASGIVPDENCAAAWAMVKNPKALDADGNRVRGHLFQFNESRTLITPTAIIKQTDDFAADWDCLLECLPAKDVAYAAYCFEYRDIQSGYTDGDLESAPIKMKLILISWAPDSLKPQVKMLVPSSFAGFKEVCEGTSCNVQMNCMDDAMYSNVCSKLGIRLA